MINGTARKTTAAALGLLLVVCAVLLPVLRPVVLPRADNTTPAGEKARHRYSDEALGAVFNTNYKYYEEYQIQIPEYEFQSLDDLKYRFEFECVRDPRMYADNFYPYIVLMSESGKKLFLFYDPETLKIICRTVIEDFFSAEEAEALINEAVENRRGRLFLRNTLEKYCIGTYVTANCMYFLVEVTDGILVLSLWNNDEIDIRSMEFYTNEQLLGENPVDLSKKSFDIWPILPIDKVSA